MTPRLATADGRGLDSGRMTRPHRPPSAPRPAGIATALPIAAAVLAAVVVFQGALDYYFSQDDFLGLARASGLAPRLDQPWRYIANQATWDLLRPLGTASAWPYHLFSLLVHVGCVALLYDLLARRLAPWAAFLGASFFAVHPSLYSALYWTSTVGDGLALAFALLVLRIQGRRDRWRWLAVPLFAFSLLSKESLILLPVAAAAYRAWAVPGSVRVPGSGTPLPRSRSIDGVLAALAAVSLLYAAYFLTVAYGSYFVARGTGASARAPYALGWGVNLWENLLTYLGWSVAFALPWVHAFGDSVDPGVFPWAAAAAAIWLAGFAWPRLRAHGWLFGGVAWLLFVLPALPLRNHTYHYYLYAPLAGAAWCVAAAAHVALPSARMAWGIAAAAVAALTLNGALLVRKIETMPFVLPVLRADPTVDRARIAWTVHESLAMAGLPAGVTLLFWSPTAASLGPRGEPLGAPAPTATYWERNVSAALLGGLAVRVMFPQVAEARFVREFRPTPPNEVYAAYLPNGDVRIFRSVEVDSILKRRASP